MGDTGCRRQQLINIQDQSPSRILLETRCLSCELGDMQTVTLAEAQKKLPDLVRQLAHEGEVLITDADHPVARLTPAKAPSLHELKPASVGSVLQPFPAAEDDLLGEMLGGR